MPRLKEFIETSTTATQENNSQWKDSHFLAQSQPRNINANSCKTSFEHFYYPIFQAIEIILSFFTIS